MKSRDLILRIERPPDWDCDEFVENVANGRPVSFVGCELYLISDIFTDFRDEIEHAIVERGLSNLLRRQLLTEAVVPPGEKVDHIRDLLIKFLEGIGVDTELIIVDPYFFASTRDHDYPALVRDILRPFVQGLAQIKIITLPNKIDPAVKQNVQGAILEMKATVTITHATSDDYHDRFWISASRSRGILTGSSLSGLGRRYAVVDRLAESDVRDIVASLVKSGLI